ncbi:MAG: hypothetical protein LBO64_00175 [Desulfovibrio sp.]|nr:hypothetical protein [Desulfovibrio sp.]
MRIVDLTLAHLRRAGHAIGCEEAARWRDCARAVAQPVGISDGDAPHMVVCCDQAARFNPEILFHTGSKLPLRLMGLDDALLLNNYDDLFSRLRKTGLPLEPAFGNSLDCATALGVTWLLQGGECLCCSFTGTGNLAALEEVLMALHLSGAAHFAGLSLLPQLSALFRQLSGGLVIAGTRPVIGHLLFTVESGIHVDGLNKDPTLYEPFPPELVGARRRVVLGAHSGCASVRLCCERLNLSCDAVLAERLLPAIRALSRKNGRSLREEEFLAVYSAVRREMDCAPAVAC